MATYYTVCGSGPSVGGMASGEVCYIAATEGAANTQRDTWATADKATADGVYGASNVREVTSTDGKTKYVIAKRLRSKALNGTSTTLDNTDEFVYAQYMTKTHTNP